MSTPNHRFDFEVIHPSTIITWGDLSTMPMVWDEDDIPHIDPDYLKARGFSAAQQRNLEDEVFDRK